ncbi:MAG TPA: hypothetical protein VHC97_01685 [Thermoanaerobaculia bacterium]|nr:hypothetical protein [Thermoanaerobaculia bacterium]
MKESSSTSSLRSEILRLLVPLAALAAMASFAAREIDPTGAAESGYLAVLAAAVLIPVGFLAPWPALELGLGAVLATAAVWALPRGPGRGTGVVLILAVALAVAAGRRLLRDGDRPSWRDSVSVLIPLALGAQALLRGNLLLDPTVSPRTLVALIALPVAGALAVAVLANRHGLPLALVAGATAVALAPGFNVAATLALIALAAGDLLGREDLGWPVKIAAGVAILAPILWNPAPGAVAAVCALALWRPAVALGLAVPVAVGLGGLFQEPWVGPLGRTLRQLAWLPLLVPAAVVPEKDRRWSVLAAALMAATVPQVPDLSTLAAPLALAALSIRRSGAATIPQRVWTGAVLSGTALLASYPWLREEPLAGALSLLGLPPGPALALWVAAVFLALAGFGAWMGRGWGETVRATRLSELAGACLLLALLLGMPPAGRELLEPETPVVLDARNPVWEAGFAGQVVRSVVVESNLSNGAGLPPGAPVAEVRLRDLAGRTVSWTLRAGEDTGEWAARRPDVAETGTRTPPAWVSWVAGDFFAQRYRSRWTLPSSDRFTQVRIERAPGAPPDLALALYQLEVRR